MKINKLFVCFLLSILLFSLVSSSPYLVKKKHQGIERHLIKNYTYSSDENYLYIDFNIHKNRFDWLIDAVNNPSMDKCYFLQNIVREDYPSFSCEIRSNRNRLFSVLSSFVNNGLRIRTNRGIDYYRGVNNYKVSYSISLSDLNQIDELMFGEDGFIFYFIKEGGDRNIKSIKKLLKNKKFKKYIRNKGYNNLLDNNYYKYYEPINKEIGIYNLNRELILKARLYDSYSKEIYAGKSVNVFDFELLNWSDTQISFLDNLTFYDINNNYSTFQRDYTLKYAIETFNQEGEQTSEIWIPFNTLSDLPKRKLRIGVFMDVFAGEKIEWVPYINSIGFIEWGDFSVTIKNKTIFDYTASAYYDLERLNNNYYVTFYNHDNTLFATPFYYNETTGDAYNVTPPQNLSSFTGGAYPDTLAVGDNYFVGAFSEGGTEDGYVGLFYFNETTYNISKQGPFFEFDPSISRYNTLQNVNGSNGGALGSLFYVLHFGASLYPTIDLLRINDNKTISFVSDLALSPTPSNSFASAKINETDFITYHRYSSAKTGFLNHIRINMSGDLSIQEIGTTYTFEGQASYADIVVINSTLFWVLFDENSNYDGLTTLFSMDSSGSLYNLTPYYTFDSTVSQRRSSQLLNNSCSTSAYQGAGGDGWIVNLCFDDSYNFNVMSTKEYNTVKSNYVSIERAGNYDNKFVLINRNENDDGEVFVYEINETFTRDITFIDYLPPTPANDTETHTVIVDFNFSIIEPDGLNDSIFNLNKTNYSILYDSQSFLNFDNNSVYDEGFTNNAYDSRGYNNGSCSDFFEKNSNCNFNKGMFGNSIDFSGKGFVGDDRIEFTKPILKDGNLTLSFWVKRGVLGTTQYLLGNRRYFFIGDSGISINFDDQDKLFLTISDSVDTVTMTSNKTINESDWYNILYSIDRSSNNVSLYINGKYDNSADISLINNFNGSYNLTLGSSADSGSSQSGVDFRGYMDEFIVRNKVYSQEQIDTLADSTIRRFNESNWVMEIALRGVPTELNYTYYGCINDIKGNENCTVERVVFIDGVPIFTNLKDLYSYVNESFYYDIDATASDGIDTFWINDTSVFNINSTTGELFNITQLINLTTYWLNVSVNDTGGDITSGVIFIKIIRRPLISDINNMAFLYNKEDFLEEGITFYNNYQNKNF